MASPMPQQRFSHNIDLCCISPQATMRHAIESLNRSGLLICCVVDDSGKLLGILTDPDLRRSMLNGITLDAPALSACNRSPFTCSADMSESSLTDIAYDTSKREIPLVDSANRLEDLFILGLHDRRTPACLPMAANLQIHERPLQADMFVLAGGLGTRLRSVVSDRPKPLAMVGDKPIIEHLVVQAVRSGFSNFFFSVNYKAEMIEDFFSQERFSHLRMEFVREPRKLGTAGSIALVRHRLTRTFVVANADLLTNFSFRSVIDFHLLQKADITAVVRRHAVKVPYGVVEAKEDDVVGLQEKPELSLLINAGIYVLSPNILSLIGDDEVLDMPDLIRRAISVNLRVKAFLMHEYWLDVGKPEDFQKANEEVRNLFES